MTDDPAVRGVMALALRPRGYTVLVLARPFAPLALALKVRQVLDAK